MKKLILSLLLLYSAIAYSQGTIPIPQVTGLPAALASKVDKVTGKSLVADTSIVKLTGVQAGAQVNKIEGIQKNGVDLTITGKKVNITVPTTAAEIGAEPANSNIQAHISNTLNPHSVTKTQVGLGSVDNTSDVNKPISSATQTALNGKQSVGTYSTDIHGNITALNAVSGTNTGDETTSTIKTKLGITTLSGANTGDQTSVTGNAGTATKLQTARTINGVAFDGTQNITVNAVDATSRVASSLLGAANGVATLDANGIILTTQLPSYIDDVLEYANLAAFPGMGETGKIYVAKDTNKTYRWAGSVYVYITSGAVDSVNGLTGVVSLSKSDLGLGNLDNTSDANKPISTATQAALNGKQASGTYSTDIHSNITALNAVSGINGGDETLTSIKTKLGAASSSNSGYLTNTDFSNFSGKQNALGFTPYNATNPNGYISGINSGMVTTALGYTPYNSTNPNGYISGINSGQVTTALGYTPWWSSNHPTTVSGYGITDIPIYSAYNVAGFHDIPITNTNTFFSSDVSGVMTNSGTTGSYGEGMRWCLAGLTNCQRILASNYNGDLFFKYQNSGVWSEFKKLYTSANLTNSLSSTCLSKWDGNSFVNSLLSDNGGNDLTVGNLSNPYTAINFKSIGQTTEQRIVSAGSYFIFDNFDGDYLFRTTSGYLPKLKILHSGDVNILNTTQSTSYTTGSLVTNGGIGVGGNIYLTNAAFIGSAAGANYTPDDAVFGGIIRNGGGFRITVGGSTTNKFNMQSNGDLDLGFSTYQGYKLAVNGTGLFSGKLRVTDVTDATIDPTPDGSIVTAGGIAAAKRIQAGIEVFSKGNIIADGAMYAGTEISCPTIHSSSFVNDTGTSSQLMVADGSLINISAVGGSVNQTQTTVNGSSSGSMVCSMPFQTSTYKKVLVRINGLTGNASYTYPAVFSYTPSSYTGSAGIAPISYSVNTTSLTLSGGSNTSGWIILEGY